MAEYNIANNAGTITADIKTAGPWICRDDSGNYWTIFQDTDNNIAICKSEDAGETWSLIKTLTTSDFTSLTMPVDTFNICHLIGQNKVYIFLAKKASTNKCWGWVINTLTDVGSVDLDNDTLTTYSTIALDKIEIRWDSYNSKLYTGQGYNSAASTGNYYYQEIKLDGTLGTATTTSISNYHKPGGFAVDSLGNKLCLSLSISGTSYTAICKGTGTSKNTTYQNLTYLFSNVICDYDNKVIFGFVIGTILHLYRVDNGLTIFEIDDSQKDLGVGHTPTIAFLTVDGNGDIYWMYTDSNDNEAYYVKYTVSTSSWGSATKISSDNDGKLISPELRSLLTDNKLLVSYQATA
jgi:hypothetical protein